MQWSIYLSGEIHTDWRDEIARGAGDAGLPVVSPRRSPTTPRVMRQAICWAPKRTTSGATTSHPRSTQFAPAR